ncbi:hypothetical protein BDZ94DRAFT_1353444 [Collybia nuda]|uniref:Uncharacterized protein n=1 Tax=Collybia nuda TaxID=64659 RepID=A0A9P6CL77_9AGAR|nr:hypothetical protein BDZ94DRAFT_1353444 [Collybia nuda]
MSARSQCDICSGWYNPRGLGRHRAACMKKFDSAQRDAAFEQVHTTIAEEPQFGDVKIEFHPYSHRPPRIGSFEDHNPNLPQIIPDSEPWKPFQSRLDFEVAELILEGALSHSLADRLIKLIHRAAENNDLDPFTLKNGAEMSKLWEGASELLTKFTKKEFVVPYKNVDQSFEIHMRDPWDWAVDIVTDSMLAPHIVWDAQIHSSWNAELLWEIQSTLPEENEHAKVLPFIIYADKTKLSSFGTAKGYPIVARLGNLPVEIRNTDGHGGGRVVGWLPIVHEDTGETGKPGFVNFKNAVWHTAFSVFIEQVVKYSKTGCWVTCGDNIQRQLWPTILILSADYEEMSVMSLIRGNRGSHPCPICLVPQKELSDLLQTFELRTQKQSEKLFHMAKSAKTHGEAEKIIKTQGLRMVENSMWAMEKMDLHRSLSYDTLHFDDNGFYNKIPRWQDLNHFESVMNITFNDGSKNRDISKIFLFAAHDILPKDRDPSGYLLLKCLRSYLNIWMYSNFDLHTEGSIQDGCNELQRFASLMQEYESIESIDSLHEADPNDMDSGDTDEEVEGAKTKSWGFPKKHLRQHLFSNIRDKGISRNSGTKVNESMHGPIRYSYLQHSNFKDPATQILRADHYLMVANSIRSKINAKDEYLESLLFDPEDSNAIPHSIGSGFDTTEYDKLRQLGSPLKTCTFSDFEQAHEGKVAFERFRIKLGEFMTRFLTAYSIPLPGNKAVKFQTSDLITEYRYLKVKYTCTSDWKMKTDYLRCNPNFFGHPRYDYVLVSSAEPYFARLVCIFTCTIGGQDYPIALIQPFSSKIPGLSQSQKAHDADLQLYQLHESFLKQCEFVSIHTFIRGAVLIHSDETTQDGHESRDYFLFDLLDSDMFCRWRKKWENDH